MNLCLLVQEKTVGSVAPVNGQKRVKLRVQKESKGKKKLVQRKSLAGLYLSFSSFINFKEFRFLSSCYIFYLSSQMLAHHGSLE